MFVALWRYSVSKFRVTESGGPLGKFVKDP